jgi:mitogen-activated protein kinase 1/3
VTFDGRQGKEEHAWAVTGKYRVTSYLASGSYGQVVRAQLTSDLSKTVVIKRTSDVFKRTVDGEFYEPAFAKCALREIAIMRRLDHPNIVKIVDILEPEEGSPMSCDELTPLAGAPPGPNPMFKNLYVVLEDGGIDLKTFFKLQKDPLSIDQIRHISRQICAAMAYLHSCRVVHRDLKPANILIDPNPSSPTYLHVRIADFGLSRAVELPPDCEIPPPSPAAAASVSPPSPRCRPIKKSQSEMKLLAAQSAFDFEEFRTVAGEEGWHACLEMEMQGMALEEQGSADSLLTSGAKPR